MRRPNNPPTAPARTRGTRSMRHRPTVRRLRRVGRPEGILQSRFKERVNHTFGKFFNVGIFFVKRLREPVDADEEWVIFSGPEFGRVDFILVVLVGD